MRESSREGRRIGRRDCEDAGDIACICPYVENFGKVSLNVLRFIVCEMIALELDEFTSNLSHSLPATSSLR